MRAGKQHCLLSRCQHGSCSNVKNLRTTLQNGYSSSRKGSVSVCARRGSTCLIRRSTSERGNRICVRIFHSANQYLPQCEPLPNQNCHKDVVYGVVDDLHLKMHRLHMIFSIFLCVYCAWLPGLPLRSLFGRDHVRQYILDRVGYLILDRSLFRTGLRISVDEISSCGTGTNAISRPGKRASNFSFRAVVYITWTPDGDQLRQLRQYLSRFVPTWKIFQTIPANDERHIAILSPLLVQQVQRINQIRWTAAIDLNPRNSKMRIGDDR